MRNGILTRKQIWRRIKKPYHKNNTIPTKSSESSESSESLIDPFTESIKKVRFSNIATVTLIPMKEEIQYYS